MANLLPNGKQQFIDINGNPLVGGRVYFYIPNTTVFKNTWQDPTQTILNTNPVVLDARGQAVIYGEGVYRQIVTDSAGNLIWDQLTGTEGDTLYAGLASGSADVIVLTLSPPLTAYIDGLIIEWKALASNTTTTPTINVNGLGALTVVMTSGASLPVGAIQIGGIYQTVYDATTNKFQLLNPSILSSGGTFTAPINMVGAAINEAEGSAIASATTINLQTATGNFVHVTGTTTIAAVTLNEGAERTVVFDGILTLTHGANLILGGANIVTAAGDVAVFRGEGSGVTRLVGYQRADQRAIQDASTTQKGASALASQAEAEGGANDTKALTPLTLRQGLRAAGSAPVFAPRAWVRFTGAAGAIAASGNVSSVTRTNTGRFVVNFATALPDANYSIDVSCTSTFGGPYVNGYIDGANSPAASAAYLLFLNVVGGASYADPATACATFYR